MEELSKQWSIMINKKGEFKEETREILIDIMNYLFQMIVKTNQKALTPIDIINILNDIKIKSISEIIKTEYFDELKNQKKKKIQDLRCDGYGNTCDHISFVQKILNSEHTEYQPPKEPIDDSEDEM